MIELKDLAKHFEDSLNLNDLLGREFIIQADTGDIKKSTRIGNRTQGYINGIMRLTSSTIENTNPNNDHAGEIAIINTTTTLILPCEDTEEANEQMIEDCRKVVDTVTAQNSLFTITKSQETQTIGATYGLSMSGVREMVAGIGESFLFIVNATYIYVVDGVYSREIKVYFKNHEPTDTIHSQGFVHIPYQQFIPFRQTMQEGELFSDKNKIENLPTATSFGFSMLVPMMNNGIGTAIRNYVLMEENTKLSVKISSFGYEKMYVMGFDRGQLTAQGVACVGCDISMSERG